MTTEQILAAIQQAAKEGLVYNPDAAVVTKVKELNANNALTFWVGTQAQYNAVSKKDPYCYYIITDKSETDVAAQAFAIAEEAKNTANTALNVANAAPKFYFGETEPTNWKNGDIWLQPDEG